MRGGQKPVLVAGLHPDIHIGPPLLPSSPLPLGRARPTSPVAAFASNDIDQVQMRQHRVAIHCVRQRVRFTPFERAAKEWTVGRVPSSSPSSPRP